MTDSPMTHSPMTHSPMTHSPMVQSSGSLSPSRFADPALPPWMQNTAGHQPAPSPSLHFERDPAENGAAKSETAETEAANGDGGDGGSKKSGANSDMEIMHEMAHRRLYMYPGKVSRKSSLRLFLCRCFNLFSSIFTILALCSLFSETFSRETLIIKLYSRMNVILLLNSAFIKVQLHKTNQTQYEKKSKSE